MIVLTQWEAQRYRASVPMLGIGRQSATRFG